MDSLSSLVYSKRLSASVLTLTALVCLNTSPLPALSSPTTAAHPNSPVIARMEMKLFFRQYANDTLPNRLSRVEKHIFGESSSGPLNERIAKLESVIGQLPAADDVVASAVPATAPITKESIAPSSAKQTAPQDDESLADRARENAVAAKDEEIAQLMADGVELWRMKQHQEALEKFEQCVRLDPNNGQAHFSMGIIEEAKGDLVKALSSYRRALRANPDDADCKEAISIVEKKVAAKEKVLSAQSEMANLAQNAVAAYKRGEYLSALDFYKLLDQKAPRQALVKYNIGTVYLVMKQPERALDYYKQAYKLNPHEPRYAQAFAQLETKLHQEEELRREAQFQAKLGR